MQWNPFASRLRAGNPHFPNEYPVRSGGSMMLSTLQQVQLAAVLHGVGNFYLRAGFPHDQSGNLFAKSLEYGSPSKGMETDPLPLRVLSEEVGRPRAIDGDLHVR